MKLIYMVRHLRQIIELQREALLKNERIAAGCDMSGRKRCPECGESEYHYYNCSIRIALAASSRGKK